MCVYYYAVILINVCYHLYMFNNEADSQFNFKNIFSSFTNKSAIQKIIILGFIVFFTSLFNPFMFDDTAQIVQNPYVNTFNIPIFFYSSAAVPNIHGLTFLHVQYKPLLYTIYTAIFAIFGLNTFPYHLLQLAIHIGNTILLFLIFSYFIKRPISLLISLLFLVHPINSESVIYIADLQDTLFLFFGLLALKIVLKASSVKLSYSQLFFITFFLLLSLLSKTTGILFLCILPLYCALFSHKNLKYISMLVVTVLILYITLLFISSHNPIFTTFPSLMQRIPLSERILSIPRIGAYYIIKFFLPFNFSIGQEWIVQNITPINFYLPLLLNIIIFASIIYYNIYLYKKGKKESKLFLFFALWFFIGMSINFQIIPLDLTVADRWFYFPIIGFLGMIGILISDLCQRIRFSHKLVILSSCSIITFLAVGTVIRVAQWQTPEQLYSHDLQYAEISPLLNNLLGTALAQNGKLNEAIPYLENAIKLDPFGGGLPELAEVYEQKKNFPQAISLYQKNINLKNGLPKAGSYEGIARIELLYYRNPKKAKEISEIGVKKYPLDTLLRAYLAMSQYLTGQNNEALKTAESLYKDQPTQLNETLYINIKSHTFSLP